MQTPLSHAPRSRQLAYKSRPHSTEVRAVSPAVEHHGIARPQLQHSPTLSAGSTRDWEGVGAVGDSKRRVQDCDRHKERQTCVQTKNADARQCQHQQIDVRAQVERAQGARTQGERAHGESVQAQGERARGEKAQGERARGERVQGERAQGQVECRTEGAQNVATDVAFGSGAPAARSVVPRYVSGICHIISHIKSHHHLPRALWSHGTCLDVRFMV